MKTILTLRIDESHKQRLNELAHLHRRTVSFIANEMITQGLEQYEQSTNRERTERGQNILCVLESKQTPTHRSSNS